MKYVAVVLAAALVCAAHVGEARPKTHPAKPKVAKAEPGPTIVKQEPGGAPDRVILTVRNPTGRALWVYIECPKVLTQEPIGIDARGTTRINLLCPDGGPGEERCRVHHWEPQDGRSPRRWEP